LAAKWEHVDLEKRIWFLPRTKNGKARHVILNDLATELLLKQPRQADNAYLFPGKVGGQPLNNPQKCFKRTLQKAGISDFRIHDLRHSHALIAIINGASLYEVQNLLGHSQAKTTPAMRTWPMKRSGGSRTRCPGRSGKWSAKPSDCLDSVVTR